MEAVIIRKKDVDRLSKDVLNDTFEFLHNEYILTNFEEIKDLKENFILFLKQTYLIL